MTDPDKLRRLLGDNDLAWLVARARQRMERGQPLDATVTLSGATAAQRAAVQRLLGKPPRPGSALSVSLPAVDEVVRRSGACPDGLAAAVVALTGDVVDRTAAADERERAWREALAPVADVVTDRPKLAEWFAGIQRTGVVRRLAGTPEAARPLLADLAAVLRDLPASGVPLGTFAARVCRGAHALDDDRPLATLALGAARALSGMAEGNGSHWRRQVWASVGVLCDDVSSTVLTLGLPGDATSATGRALASWQEVGQPVVLTLRQLVRDPPVLSARRVFVCENPVVVSAAADRLGAHCALLVCTSGQPGVAAVHLLRQLADAGAELYYHGDFDWGGVRIGNTVFERLPVKPWRFESADYRAVAEHGQPLSGTPVAARWDRGLAAEMRAAQVAVEEEHVLDDLLDDLA